MEGNRIIMQSKMICDFMKNNPITAAVTAGAAIFGGSILKYLGESAMWLLNGKLLGMGFNSVASGGGGGGGSSSRFLSNHTPRLIGCPSRPSEFPVSTLA